MRTYVRRWINEWDLRRLYPGRTLNIEEILLQVDYTESPELQQPSEDSSADSTGAG